jgi:hypothetical protein
MILELTVRSLSCLRCSLEQEYVWLRVGISTVFEIFSQFPISGGWD